MPFISRLRLTDFRSYAELNIELTGAPVVLFGPNGAGKTNLLEALSLLSPGRGLRRAKPEDFLRAQNGSVTSAWGMGINLLQNSDDDIPTEIALGCLPEAPRRRQLRIDGSKATGPMLAEKISALWLTPAQDRLFSGSASDRRKFIDRMCLAHFSNHGRLTLRYEKARSDRNRLLSDGVDDALWYDALETEMAECGAQIAMARHFVCEALNATLALRPESAFPKGEINLDGEIETLFKVAPDVHDAEDHFRKMLKDCRSTDMRAGRTLRGIHKTDFTVTHLPKSIEASQCSTGEQKALLIALVLAHGRALAEKRPNRGLILLLDELAAHLDVDRRAALAEELITLPAHIFMTGTDESLFDAFGARAQRFEVESSRLKQL